MRIQLDPVSFPQQQEGQVHEDPAQEPELDAVGPEGQVREDPVQDIMLDTRKTCCMYDTISQAKQGSWCGIQY